MRSTSAALLAILPLLFSVLSCQATPSAEGESSESSKSESAEKATPDEAEGSAKESKKDAESKKETEEEKAEEAQKEWDEAIEDLERVSGLFTLHHSESKLLLELNEKSLGQEFLYYGALESGAGFWNMYRGAMLWKTSFVLRFERRGEDHVMLVARNTRYLDPGDEREREMLSDVTSEGILNSFKIEAELEAEKRLLIDLGSWFEGDNLELAKSAPGKGFSVNEDLSVFRSLDAFPRNIEIDQELVLTGGSGGNLTLADPGSLALKVRHSLCALPSDGYRPRPYDQRVGYFFEERKDLFDVDSVDPVRRYINRWRLAKQDPSAEVSDPVQPIVYWIENSTPKRWRDAVRAGIEAWEPAFRRAGFSNAIVAKQMPGDADWEPGDVRYSVVRWSADENVGFAIGPSRVDPRTGEIFDADITMQESFVRVYSAQYEHLVERVTGHEKVELLAQLLGDRDAEFDSTKRMECRLGGEERRMEAARVMALAATLQPDFDRDAFLQAMITETVAHEVGHTLGLRHNFKASTWRPVSELSNVVETSENGLVGSVMDYNPIILAAPGEEQGEFFASVPGPYDMWAIEYGYREFGGRSDAALNAIASRSPEPGLDFGTDEDLFIGDALCRTWDIGKNPVDYSEKQIALAEAGLAKLREKGAEEGDGYHRYAQWYAMFSRHYQGAYKSLGRFLGGWSYNRDLVGQEQGRAPIVPIDLDTQERALNMLCERGLSWTGGIPDEDRLLLANRKYGDFGGGFNRWSLDQVTQGVNLHRFSILTQLLDGDLYLRLGTQARLSEGAGLSPHAVADRVFAAVWPASPDEHDRWAQSDFVNIVLAQVGIDNTPDVSALFEDLLKRAESEAGRLAQSTDAATKAHGLSLSDRIKRYRERQQIEF